MASKHTPGPWTVGLWGVTVAENGNKVHSEGQHYAVGQLDTNPPLVLALTGRADDSALAVQSLADALFIAKAPERFAALQNIAAIVAAPGMSDAAKLKAIDELCADALRQEATSADQA